MALIQVYINDGRQIITVPGTRVPLVYVSAPAKKVIVQAEVENLYPLTVGGPNVVHAKVTRQGTVLYASDSVTLEISDLNTVYLDGPYAGEGATFLYMI